MSVNVTMPALSPTMTSGTVAKWTIAIGDRVHSGDVIAEIETDKATMEVEAIEDGVVAQILVEAGTQNVAVGTIIAVLAEDDARRKCRPICHPNSDTTCASGFGEQC